LIAARNRSDLGIGAGGVVTGDIAYWVIHSRILTTTGLNWVHDHLDFIKSIALETLPAAILLGPAVAIVARRWRASEPDLMLAAVLYSVICTLVLVCWPGGVAARYAMPATMTLAVVCGLMFERWRTSRPRPIASALFVCYLKVDRNHVSSSGAGAKVAPKLLGSIMASGGVGRINRDGSGNSLMTSAIQNRARMRSAVPPVAPHLFRQMRFVAQTRSEESARSHEF
jgi:hypothetical protein